MNAISGYNSTDIVYKYFDNSFFQQYFDINDPEILTWALNVLEKLYGKGILPNYVERDSGSNNIFEDEQLISFLYTKTHFFAILVKYIRVLTDITGNELIKRKFMDQIGMHYKTNETQPDLDYILDNYISEFKKRGTQLIYAKKGEQNQLVDGELLRLIDYKISDEFMFALLNNSEHGWCIGISSPAYSASDHVLNLIKAYEFGSDVTDLSLYPLLNSSYISLSDGKMAIDTSSAVSCGVQFDDDENKKIPIDTGLCYEISFRVKCSTPKTVTFGVDVYDIDGNYLYLRNLKTDDPSIDNNICTFTIPLSDITYWVRGFIAEKGRIEDNNDSLNIGIGNNLIFQSNEKYIVPRITVDEANCHIKLSDIKVRVISLPFDLTFLGVKNLAINIFKNNKGILDDNISYTIKNDLIPYNVLYAPVKL